MAFEISERPQLVDPAEIYIYHPFDHLTVVAKSGTAPGELWCPCCFAINPATDHIYVAEGHVVPNFARISIFSETGQYLNSYTHEHMESLYGIAIHGNNVYVTDTELHSVFQLKIEPEFRLVARQGSLGSGIGQFNYPGTLSTSPNGDVYIVDGYNDRIVILDSFLHPIRNVTHPSIHLANDLKVTTEEMYVLSQDSFHCIHVFTLSGDKIRSLITYGEGLEGSHGCFFCLDNKNNLIISDTWDDHIKIFSNEGILLNTIPKCEHRGVFNATSRIALNSKLNLIVVSIHDECALLILS